MVGIITPRKPFAAAHSTSRTPRSISCETGTSPMPARRAGLAATSSARKRLWARAPAREPFGEEVVEGGGVRGVEIGPVLLAGQAGVAVRRDDQVSLAHRDLHVLL